MQDIILFTITAKDEIYYWGQVLISCERNCNYQYNSTLNKITRYLHIQLLHLILLCPLQIEHTEQLLPELKERQ